ncbi:glycosyltransferase family protein [Paenibacillus hamazuiensis]|uniref:glycosyltransferase family protein n=1 Tax=Paenibacillus hamazuiensis TaxID=2936508 RepID=UPI00200EE85C|nr:glycosyltransferase [Paenibacillus hamazuiensis]
MSTNKREQDSTQDSSRRLAVIDTWFPWKQSGFRYWENMQIFSQRPDTLFFAIQPYHDEFPAPVHHFSQFKSLAVSERITDIYCVFLNLTLSLFGTCSLPDGSNMPGSNPSWNIGSFLEERQIRLHATIYPGGGLSPLTNPEFLRIAGRYCSTIFTNVEEVLLAVPGSLYHPVVINTDLYDYSPKLHQLPIQLAFSAYNSVRKGFPLMADGFNRLSEHFHLHLIGNWDDHLHLLTNKNYTFHGILSPERLKSVYEKCHVFLNCSIPDQYALDGFPTTSAVDAMSTGCVLVSTNPRNDRLILEPEKDFIEVQPSGQAIADALFWIKDHFGEAMQIGANGANKIKNRFDAKQIVKSKLSHIFSE